MSLNVYNICVSEEVCTACVCLIGYLVGKFYSFIHNHVNKDVHSVRVCMIWKIYSSRDRSFVSEYIP